jgi:hypothetical protein
MGQSHPSPRLLVIPLDDILAQIDAAVRGLTRNKSIPFTGIKIETLEALDSLMRQVIKIAHSGFFPELGPRLYAKFQELDISAGCSNILALDYPLIINDQQTKDFLEAITFLKLAALCAVDEARYEWASFAEIVTTVSLQHEALNDGDWITLYNNTDCNYDYISTLHDIVGLGMYLMCKAYKKKDRKYMLYRLLLNEQDSSNIPHGVACANYDQITTESCVNFLVRQLDGRYY